MEFIYSVDNAWYQGVYRDKKEPINAGRSFSLLHENESNTAVLCIHGYAGYPGELVRPAVDLYNLGYDIFVPRLPGAGTSGDDFLNTSAKDWVKVAITAAEDLVSRYENVYVVAHSMGGAIAAVVASRVKGIKKMVLAAPALFADKKGLPAKLWQIRLLSILKKKIHIEWHPDPSYKMYYENAPADDETFGAEYWSWLYPKQLLSLSKLMIFSSGEIDKIKCPTLIFVSGKDQVIKTDSVVQAFDKLQCEKKLVRLENATHYIFYDKDKSEEERAVKETLSWLIE